MWGKRDDMLVHEEEPYNAEPPPHALAGELVTAVDTFYVRDHGPIPRIDPTAWRLRVDGLVTGRSSCPWPTCAPSSPSTGCSRRCSAPATAGRA